MKKILALALCMTLTASVLTGCGSTDTETSSESSVESTVVESTVEESTVEESSVEESSVEEVATEAGAAKTGLAVVSSLEKSKDAAADADGLAEVDSTVVAVLVGEDGTILACDIDFAQTKINFSAAGTLTTDAATTFKSKQDLGDEYGMKGSSGIGKEWYEQADAFAAYVVGKTVDEVKGIAVDESGVTTDADLVSSVTVHVTDFIAGVEKAVANAQDLGATSTDKLGLSVSTEISKSKDAAADAEGQGQAYSTYVVATTDADGKITSCYVDMSQGTVKFDATGVITSDLTVAPQTKQELGEDYGMKASSGIGKEWYEQANAFSAYVVGKTAAEVSGIAVDESNHVTDADLVSSVTVTATPFIAGVSDAATKSAK